MHAKQRSRCIARNAKRLDCCAMSLPESTLISTFDLQVTAGHLQQATMLPHSKRVAAAVPLSPQRQQEPLAADSATAASRLGHAVRAPSSLAVLPNEVLAAILLRLEPPQRAVLLGESSLLRRVGLSQRVLALCFKFKLHKPWPARPCGI